MFDVELNGVSILALILGITEALKQLFDLEGKANIGAALIVAFVLFGVAGAESSGLIPEAAMVWVNLIIYALAGALSAGGYYSLAKRSGSAVLGAWRSRL